MFDRLKQWTVRALDCVPLGGRASPPPVPPPLRPPKPPPAPAIREGESCCCHNCRVLEEVVGECPICLEPISVGGLCLCESCGNPTCPGCAGRLAACPFCRHPRPPAHQPALDRLLARLRLPAPPAQAANNEDDKEKQCCPVDESCDWKGEGETGAHLESAHGMSLLEGSALTLEIGGFRRKARSSRSYSVALGCHSRVFVARVSLGRPPGRLSLSVASPGRGVPSTHHAAWLEVASTSRTVKAILPVSNTANGKQKRLQVSAESLVSPWKHGSDDTVRISVTIRPLS